ncbi:hypothetical protein QF001_000391 [Paraburkholderia youngii]
MQLTAFAKGKVERFERHLKESFVVPLAATLKQSGLTLDDVEAAHAHIGRCLSVASSDGEVNARSEKAF